MAYIATRECPAIQSIKRETVCCDFDPDNERSERLAKALFGKTGRELQKLSTFRYTKEERPVEKGLQRPEKVEIPSSPKGIAKTRKVYSLYALAEGYNDFYRTPMAAHATDNLLAFSRGTDFFFANKRFENITIIRKSKGEPEGFSIQWHHEELLEGCINGSLCVWNVDKLEKAEEWNLSKKGATVRDIAVDVEKGRVAAGLTSGHIKVLDRRIGVKNIATLSFKNEIVDKVAFSKIDHYMAVGLDSGYTAIYDVRNVREKKPLHELPMISEAACSVLQFLPWSRDHILVGHGRAAPILATFNVKKGVLEQQIHTGAQICSMQLSEEYEEVLCTHGFYTDHEERQKDVANSITLWKWDRVKKGLSFSDTVFQGTERMLYSTLCSDKRSVVVLEEPINVYVFENLWPKQKRSTLTEEWTIR